MQDTSIEWAERSWNPVRGCSRVSEGCRHCYAETLAARFSDPGMWGETFAKRTPDGGRWTGKVELLPGKLAEPLRLKAPSWIFANSTSDLFHERLPYEHVAAVWGVMAATPRHTYMVLTKRPERAREFLTSWLPHHAARLSCKPQDLLGGEMVTSMKDGGHTRADLVKWHYLAIGAAWPLSNVILGTSCEDQATADARIPHLLHCPAACHMVSAEPLLGPIDFHFPAALNPTKPAGFDDLSPARQEEVIAVAARAAYIARTETPGWVIVGGESGHGARPFDIAWARSIRDQCREAEVPCFVKQLGARPLDASAFRWYHHSIEGEEERLCLPGNPLAAASVFGNGTWFARGSEWGNGRSGVEADKSAAKRAALAVVMLEGRFPLRLKDRKGGDPSEWSEDLRVRQMPSLEPPHA